MESLSEFIRMGVVFVYRLIDALTYLRDKGGELFLYSLRSLLLFN